MILPIYSEGNNDERVPVKISVACLNQKFNPCEPSFVENVCKGRCCESTKGISVIVHPHEQERIAALGADVKNGYIVADERNLCPFKTDSGQCSIHTQKPFGCRASPFTLNSNGTLIVRNRYRRLKCYKSPHKALPAYEAHYWSLCQIFGNDTADEIIACVKTTKNKFVYGLMPKMHYDILMDNHVRRNR